MEVSNELHNLNKQRKESAKQYYENKSKIMNNGLSLKVLKYIDYRHLLCEWEIDKSQVITRVPRFNKGSVRYSKKNEYLTQDYKMKNGKIAKIIQYDSYKKVTIILDNDYSKTYTTSMKSLIRGIYTSNDKLNRMNHIGEKHITAQGIIYTISDIYGKYGYTITFLDGTSKTISSYTKVVSKSIKHPLIKYGKTKFFNYHKLTCRYIYADNTNTYFVCKCNKCGYDEILSANELVELGEHKCEGI